MPSLPDQAVKTRKCIVSDVPVSSVALKQFEIEDLAGLSSSNIPISQDLPLQQNYRVPNVKIYAIWWIWETIVSTNAPRSLKSFKQFLWPLFNRMSLDELWLIVAFLLKSVYSLSGYLSFLPMEG